MLFALGESACGLHESARLIDWLARESAGQCGPCVHGLDAIAGAYDALAEGLAHPSEAKQIRRWVDEIQGRGACHHPDGVGRLALSALRVFGAGDGHRAARCRGPPRRPAAARPEGRLMSARLRVNPIACEGHGVCAELLPELIHLDDWGYPVLSGGRGAARAAAARAPRGRRLPDARAAARRARSLSPG